MTCQVYNLSEYRMPDSAGGWWREPVYDDSFIGSTATIKRVAAGLAPGTYVLALVHPMYGVPHLRIFHVTVPLAPAVEVEALASFAPASDPVHR